MGLGPSGSEGEAVTRDVSWFQRLGSPTAWKEESLALSSIGSRIA